MESTGGNERTTATFSALIDSKMSKKPYGRHIYKCNVSCKAYHPKASMEYAYGVYNLKIDCSVQKLLIGNNVEEFSDNVYESFILELRKSAKKHYGLILKDSEIRNAIVMQIHYSKNVITDDSFATINERLEQSVTPKTFDVTMAKYGRSGSKRHYYNKSREFVIYDKFEELKSHSESSRHISEQKIIDEFDTQKSLIRFESRLKNKRVIRNKLDLSGPTLEEVFNPDLPKKLINEDWKGITRLYAGNHTLLDEYDQNGNLRVIGAIALIRDHGTRAFRKVFERFSSHSSWSRLNKELRIRKKVVDPIQNITDKLKSFKPIVQDDFNWKMD